MDEKLTLLNHKVEETCKQVKDIESEIKVLTIKVAQHEEKFPVVEHFISDLQEKKASVHNLNNKNGQILFLSEQQKEILKHSKKQDDAIASHELSIGLLIKTTESLAKSSDKIVQKLNNITTPRTIGLVMGGVVAFCGFVLSIIKLLNML